MATIRRHPVPLDSYEPNRPLNDLGRDQFRHFTHVAERLSEKLRATLPPVPSPEDGMAASNFVAAVTEILMARKRQPLTLVRGRKLPKPGLALAAASDAPPHAPKRKQRARSKPKSRSPGA